MTPPGCRGTHFLQCEAECGYVTWNLVGYFAEDSPEDENKDGLYLMSRSTENATTMGSTQHAALDTLHTNARVV